MKNNLKSDKNAKEAFVGKLEANGFTNVRIVKAPSDIIATKDGKQWYFEIKMTSNKDKYFGAATFTEWEQAFTTPDSYRFVIAVKDELCPTGFDFIELTPEEMMQYSTIPPCKVYFNLNISDIKAGCSTKKTRGKSKAIKFSLNAFNIVSEAFWKLRSY